MRTLGGELDLSFCRLHHIKPRGSVIAPRPRLVIPAKGVRELLGSPDFIPLQGHADACAAASSSLREPGDGTLDKY